MSQPNTVSTIRSNRRHTKPAPRRVAAAFDAVTSIPLIQLLDAEEDPLGALCDLLDFSELDDALPSYTVSRAKRVTWGEAASIALTMRSLSSRLFAGISRGGMAAPALVDCAYRLRDHADRLILVLLHPARLLADGVSGMHELPVDHLKATRGRTFYAPSVLFQQRCEMIDAVRAHGFTFVQAAGIVDVFAGATCGQLWGELERRAQDLGDRALDRALACEHRTLGNGGMSRRFRERSALNAYCEIVSDAIMAGDYGEAHGICEANARFMFGVLAPLGLLPVIEAELARTVASAAQAPVEKRADRPRISRRVRPTALDVPAAVSGIMLDTLRDLPAHQGAVAWPVRHQGASAGRPMTRHALERAA